MIHFKDFLLCILLTMLFSGCAKRDKNISGKYSFYILSKGNKELIITTDSLKGGVLKPENEGVLLDGADMDRDIIVKDGFIYHLNRKTAQCSKSVLSTDSLTIDGQLLIDGFSLENYSWVGKDSLLLVGLNSNKYNQVTYRLLNVKNMNLLREGNLPIPKPSGKFKSISVGFTKIKGQSIFLGYTYHFPVNTSDYSTSDTMYVSRLSYPDMRLLGTDKDSRSTYPGGLNAVQNYSFTDEQGDYYFMTCPGIALGNRPDLPTAIFRIKANDLHLDKSYFFNISDSKIANHAYGMWNLGNNEVVIRSERKDLFTGLGDHYSAAHFEFYVLNLKTKTISKLNLPLDKGTRRECVMVKDGIAYIAVNSSKEGNYIWLYNIKTKSLKKGLQLAGDTDFILRIDQMK
ncbi:DUF4374 domain-containing protein [Pedobacter agri]|uniref:DUF4374 domain-containing protein n=1 Tax=Pedobacter agri TaxID=454586 RepID=UPI002931B667|nr:DUF4374 domain-containing protein [Pedobacter agri]